MQYLNIKSLLEGRHHFAPNHDSTCMLDVGTGTGMWAIDPADEYPAARVIGFDLSPI